MGVPSQNSPILIISNRPLFVDAITHVLNEEGLVQVALMQQPTLAKSFLPVQGTNVVIVDYDPSQFSDSQHLFQALDQQTNYLVIFLTRIGNEMLVHHHRRIKNATSSALIEVIYRFQEEVTS